MYIFIPIIQHYLFKFLPLYFRFFKFRVGAKVKFTKYEIGKRKNLNKQ